MDQNDLAAMATQALFSVLGGAANTAASQLTQDRLNRSARGRAALDGLSSSPDDPAAQRDVQAALADEISSDSEFADRLTVLLHAPAQQTTGSVVITGSRVRHSQIALGPLTINNTPGARGALAFAAALLIVLIALGVYGGVRLINTDDAPKTQSTTQHDASDSRLARAAVLSAEDLKLAALEESDLPPDVTPTPPWNELKITDPKANPAACQPIVDLYSAQPRRPRHARLEGALRDTRGGDYYGYRVYLDSYASTDEASGVLKDLRNTLEACTSNFSIDGSWEFQPVSKALDPEVGDESLAFGEESDTKYNVVRVGTVLIVLTSSEQKTYEGEGKIDPTILNAQVTKVKRAIAQVGKD
ncbi:hypothetical protein [Streptomyces solicathayae]|uniref:PknH-like extracellular domain-containing protein n=1 Tax=Streptomyces solicathayae TaxID=3081768 RepID=A0ABZ0LM20_9ACTN|nr:hypothetical protein [Streptomyces sp. HUAS YS2]WOX19903.1 hypothetical protein R2D22_00145 [Streptomyces sp. HUAS YS2]